MAGATVRRTGTAHAGTGPTLRGARKALKARRDLSDLLLKMRDVIATSPAAPAAPAPTLAPRRAIRTAIRVDRRPAFALAGLVVASAAVRAVFAVKHSVPHYFPDEYVYAALGRALAHGNLQIRGTTSHFPAILEPLVAAPLWRLFSTTTAYHLIQVENAVLASLAAVPIYLLARWLTLGRRYAFFCAVVGIALPDLVFSGYIVSDPLAYPLILGTIFAGVTAIETPSPRRQVAFLALATLSTLARVEYAVVVLAYLAAAVAIERRRVVRVHWVALAAVIPGAAAGIAGAVSYYLVGGTGSLHLHPLPLAHWFVLQAFLLTIASGVVIVPGAVAALLRPSGRKETIYAVFTLTFSVLVLGAASEVAVGTTHFKERYLFSIVPLLAVAFGSYLRRCRLRPLALVLAAAIAIALAELPLSGYTAATFKGDSPFLEAVWNLQLRLDTASASLLVAAVATVGCALAAAAAFGKLRRVGLAFVLAFLALSSGFTTVEDLRATSAVRGVLPADLTWVGDAKPARPVTAVATTDMPSFELRETLFWNPSIQREVVLPGAYATDVLPTPTLRIGASGAVGGVRGDVLFDDSGAVGALADAHRVAGVPGFTLWRPIGTPRFQLLVDNRYWDGWLGVEGHIRAWPVAPGRAVAVSFTASVPRQWQRARLHLGAATIVVAARRDRRVTCRSSSGALDVPYWSPDLRFSSSQHVVSARMTNVRVSDVTPQRRPGPDCTAVR